MSNISYFPKFADRKLCFGLFCYRSHSFADPLRKLRALAQDSVWAFFCHSDPERSEGEEFDTFPSKR